MYIKIKKDKKKLRETSTLHLFKERVQLDDHLVVCPLKKYDEKEEIINSEHEKYTRKREIKSLIAQLQ